MGGKEKLALAGLLVFAAVRIALYWQTERSVTDGRNVHRNWLGITTVEMQWAGGLRQGYWRGVTWRGETSWDGSYARGERDGRWRTFAAGHLISEGFYSSGRRTGIWRSWSEAGRLLTEGAYSSGQREGKWRTWSEDGFFTLELFRHDRKHGPALYYFPNGKAAAAEFFENGTARPFWRKLEPARTASAGPGPAPEGEAGWK